MKRMLSVVLFLMLLLGTVQVYANGTADQAKQTLPVLIVNNLYSKTRPSLAQAKAEMYPVVFNKFKATLDSKYDVKQLDNTFNIEDVASTEKNDILDMFKGTDYPAVILVEILPANVYYALHVKILDLKTEKYLYNGKLWRENSGFYKSFNAMSGELDDILKTAFKL